VALNHELLLQRATQACPWALPAVNLMATKEGSEKAFASGYNVFPVAPLCAPMPIDSLVLAFVQ
jgi:hypothetical protein